MQKSTITALMITLGLYTVPLQAANFEPSVDPIQNKINSITQDARMECGDSFKLNEAAIVLEDLDLDGEIDFGVLNEAGYSCSEFGASYYCGSGGCSIHLITMEDYLRGTAQSWEIITTQHGEKVVLLSLHGSSCDEPGSTVCYKVISISKGKFIYQK